MSKAVKKEKPVRPVNPGVERAIKKAGSQEALAEIMGVEQPAVHHWLYNSIQPSRAKEIEEKLGIPREEICPEVFS